MYVGVFIHSVGLAKGIIAIILTLIKACPITWMDVVK